MVAYCEENKVSYQQRLAELGINAWSFYNAKRKYAPRQEGENAGEFLQLVSGGTFLPDPIKPARSRSGKQKHAEQSAAAVTIELRTPTGTMMRIVGDPMNGDVYMFMSNWQNRIKLGKFTELFFAFRFSERVCHMCRVWPSKISY